MKRKAAGWSLMGLGTLGLVLPFLQGFLFLALGVFVLRHQYLWAHRGMGWVAERWPGTVSKVEEMEDRLIIRTHAARHRIGVGLRRILRR